MRHIETIAANEVNNLPSYFMSKMTIIEEIMQLDNTESTMQVTTTRPGRVVLFAKKPDSRILEEAIRLAEFSPDGPDEAERLALTTVLLSVAGSDRKYRRSEIRHVCKILQSRYKLCPREVHGYIERVVFLFSIQGRRTLTRNALQFLKARKSKALLLEVFWMIAAIVRADRKIVRSEIWWLRRFVHELSLSAQDCRRALQDSQSFA